MMGLAPSIAPGAENGAYVLLDLVGGKRAAEYRERLDALIAARDEANASVMEANTLRAQAKKDADVAVELLHEAEKAASANRATETALNDRTAALDKAFRDHSKEVAEHSHMQAALSAELAAREKAVGSRERRLDESEAIAAQTMKSALAIKAEAERTVADIKGVMARVRASA